MIRVGSLFAGIGGIEHGLELASPDFKPAFFVEWDSYCQNVLKQHWPEVPIYGDITLVDWNKVPPIDILTGGFPCQDISNAGKRAGITLGKRSSLWKEYLRAICALRPRVALIENVGALARRGLNVVLADLASAGYDAEWFTLSARSVGAPHLRKRLFIIATDTSSVGRRPRNDSPSNTGEWQGCQDRQAGSQVGSQPDKRSQALTETNVAYPYRDGKVEQGRNRDDEERDSAPQIQEWGNKQFGLKRTSTNDAELPNANGAGLEAQRPEQQTARIGGRDTQELPNTDGSRVTEFPSPEERRPQKLHTQIPNTDGGAVEAHGKLGSDKEISRTRQRQLDAFRESAGSNQWSFEPELDRLAHGPSYGLEPPQYEELVGLVGEQKAKRISSAWWKESIKSLGNAVVPQCAQFIAERIKQVLK